MSDQPTLRLRIVGHTDNQGAFEYNRDLSQRRAQAVVDMLVEKHDLAADRLGALGASYSSPVATNHTDDGRAKNRRVSLVEE